MTDFHYLSDGLLVTVIPNSPQAVAEYNRLPALQSPVLITHWPAAKAQIKAAGYSVRKSPAVRVSDDELLAALERVS